MHDLSVFWLRFATILYAAGLLHAILSILNRKTTLFGPALVAFCAGVLFHFVSLVELAVINRTFPAHNFFETVSVCGFLIAVVFLFVYWRYQFQSLSVFLFPTVFIMALLGGMGSPVPTWADTRVRDAWLIVHVMLVLSGYAAILLTAGAAVFYLVQERHLKRKQPGRLFDRLPPLGTLDNLVTRSMSIGFVLITLAVVAGSTWAFIETGTRWIGEAKITIAFITWGFYLLMVFLRLSAGWRGRKAAILALAVLGCSVLTWAAHVGLRSLFVR
jgi:ABC-type transport system involved in cytochrome c biogenesis permease subunit